MTHPVPPSRAGSSPDTGRRSECAAAGATTAYWEYGTPGLPVLVAVHGLRGTHHGLLPVVSHLRRYRTVVPDLPGFGESAPLPGRRHDVASYSAWLRDFLHTVGHQNIEEGTGRAAGVVLLGHSFGSVLAAAAVAQGAPVRALVLLNPITEPSPRPVRRTGTRIAVAAHRAAARLPTRIGSALLHNEIVTRRTGSALMVTGDRRLRRWIHAEHRRHFGSFSDPGVLRDAFETASREHVGSYAPGIDAPTLLLAGEHDVLAPLADQHTLARRFPNARLEVLCGTGHLAHYETPAAVARVVDRTAAEPAP